MKIENGVLKYNTFVEQKYDLYSITVHSDTTVVPP